MSETANKKKSKKGLIIGIVVAVLLIGGGVGAFLFQKASTPKAKYFLAIQDTYEKVDGFVDNRFGMEKEIEAFMLENPTKSNVDLSANYNDVNAFGMSEFEEIINNISLNFDVENDFNEKETAMNIDADVLGMSFDSVVLGLNSSDLLMDFPFHDNVLKISDEDIMEFMKEEDPMAEEYLDVNFEKLYDQQELFTDKEKEYIEDEYMKFLFDELDEDYFTAEEEEIESLGDKVKAEKITLQLDEDEFSNIAEIMLSKAEDDETLKEIVIDKLFQGSIVNVGEEDEIDELYEESIEAFIETFVDDAVINNLQSVFWIDDGEIIKQELTIEIDDAFNEGELTVEGHQKITDEEVTFAYEVLMDSDFENVAFDLNGNLTWEDNEAEDEITLTFDDDFEEISFVYEGEEQLDGEEKTFNRQFGMESMYVNLALNWEGTASFDGKESESDNVFSVDLNEFGLGEFELYADNKVEKIDQVTLPDVDGATDLGSMSLDELEQFIMEDLTYDFQSWIDEEFMMPGF